MGNAAILVWTAFTVLLAALGLRAWITLKQGRRFQEDLSKEPTEALLRFLSAPRASDAARPADILYRLNALMEFERRGDPRLLPLYIELLSDPHPSVVSVCRETLKEMTGEDFRDPANETLPDPAAWKAWWEANRGRYAGA